MSAPDAPERAAGRTPAPGLAVGIAILSCAIAACGANPLLGPGAEQGVEGLVLLGPQCPVQRPGDACPDLPYQADIEVRTNGGAHVTLVRSGEDGRFRVGLRPGSYELDPRSGDPFPVASSQIVVVERGVYAEVLISFDTGIR